ncbi:hypothetical protein L210DRAFT_3585930 [Boletus edulis BED1]|uniref:Uncharacterized protein n=1 Tax=Boletus edulis BED1 TaxID=1328754 RepID=A0AAD4G530_BOLED|nr:hypothetical protein L210DRAFT_3585930 [Boletus edulis BED1]
MSPHRWTGRVGGGRVGGGLVVLILATISSDLPWLANGSPARTSCKRGSADGYRAGERILYSVDKHVDGLCVELIWVGRGFNDERVFESELECIGMCG